MEPLRSVSARCLLPLHLFLNSDSASNLFLLPLSNKFLKALVVYIQASLLGGEAAQPGISTLKPAAMINTPVLKHEKLGKKDSGVFG